MQSIDNYKTKWHNLGTVNHNFQQCILKFTNNIKTEKGINRCRWKNEYILKI